MSNSRIFLQSRVAIHVDHFLDFLSAFVPIKREAIDHMYFSHLYEGDDSDLIVDIYCDNIDFDFKSLDLSSRAYDESLLRNRINSDLVKLGLEDLTEIKGIVRDKIKLNEKS